MQIKANRNRKSEQRQQNKTVGGNEVFLRSNQLRSQTTDQLKETKTKSKHSLSQDGERYIGDFDSFGFEENGRVKL